MQLIGRTELESKELIQLAPYAVKSIHSRGREFHEPEDETRTAFQRDRDRIIHAKAFRRLSGKTQVFFDSSLDHVRDRLSHSLEVAQVARDIARNLVLNEDLVEAISLAHDLGHTPFGHAGEYRLNEIMQKFGLHFEHNEQSKRIVEKLEKQFPNFDGLNLTHEVRDGLAKHQTRYDRAGQQISGKTLEAQIADLADEIAYHNHDLDDGLRAGLFSLRDLDSLELWRRALGVVAEKYGDGLEEDVIHRRGVSQMISLMIGDILETSMGRIGESKITTMEEVLLLPESLICFSGEFGNQVQQVRDFLWDRMYNAPKVLEHSRRGQDILEKVYFHFHKNPTLLPAHFYGKIDAEDGLEIVVKDYIAGMTDRYITHLSELDDLPKMLKN